MANDDQDLRKLVQELLKEGSAKQQQLSQEEQSRLRSILRDYKSITELQEELNGLINKGKESYEEVAKKIETAKQNKNDLVDAEQIIIELQEEQAQQLKNQFQINQKAYLQVLEQIKLKNQIVEKGGEAAKQATEDLKYLVEKQAILKDITFKQGGAIQDLEREKKLKEGILSIAKQIWQVSQQYGSELEKHIISISKSNGGYAGLLGNLREAGRLSQAATLGTGITGPENMKALEALSEGFIGLTTYSAQSISNMQVATAQLTKVGVSSASAAKGFDSLVTAMGKTPEQAGKIQESFVQMAAKNRLALSSVSQAFAENSSRFVGYGEKMTKVLDGLAEQSLKTGVAIGKLVGIAQGFDTFEDASRKVGNLNALLGGDYFNSIELLTASDEERIKLLKDGVAASGIQFENMNRFQKMAIANAAGITDLNEASKLFGQTSLQNTRQQAESAEVQKTLAEQASSVSLGMDKLTSTLNGLFIALDPLIEGFRIIVDLLVFLPNQAAKFGGPLGAAITSIIIGIGVLILKNTLLSASWNFVAGGIAKATARLAAWKATNAAGGASPTNAIPAAADGMPATGASPASSATGGLLANAGNMLKAAGAILIFAAALWVLAKAFQEFGKVENPVQAVGLAVGALLIFTGAMTALNRVQGEIIKGSIIIGIMSLVLLGLAIVLSKFINVDWKLVAGIGAVIIGLALAIVGLGAVFLNPITATALAAGMTIIQAIAVVIGILALALTAVVLAISSASPAITNLANSFKVLFEIKDLKQNLSDLESFFSQLSNINVEPINNLANAIYNLATNLQTLAAIPSKMGINVTGKTDLAETINKTVASAAEATSAVSQASSRTAAQTLIPAQQTTAFVPLIVQIDKKTIVQILQKDIESIAKGTALDTISAVGIVQSNSNIQDLLSGYTPAEQG